MAHGATQMEAALRATHTVLLPPHLAILTLRLRNIHPSLMGGHHYLQQVPLLLLVQALYQAQYRPRKVLNHIQNQTQAKMKTIIMAMVVKMEVMATATAATTILTAPPLTLAATLCSQAEMPMTSRNLSV